MCVGWRFGAVYGKSGVFPSEFIRPVAAPDFLVLPPERVEPRDRQGRVAASAAVAVAMGSAVAAHELDLSTEVLTAFFYSFFLLFQASHCQNNRLKASVTYRAQHEKYPYIMVLASVYTAYIGMLWLAEMEIFFR